MGGALFVAAIAVSSIATAVSADLGDSDGANPPVSPGNPKPDVGGYIRVQPAVATDKEDQRAPTVIPGINAQAGGNLQVQFPDNFESGDRILISVFPDGSQGVGGTLGNGVNCVDLDKSVGYSAVPVLDPATGVTGPFDGNQGAWGGQDFTNDPRTQLNGGNGLPDPSTPGTATPKPIVAVSLASSSQCAPNGFKDVIVLTFSNQSGPDTAATRNDQWVLTLTGIQYNVGKSVPAGPLHNVPFSQQGVDGTDPLSYQDTPLFGGNDAPGGNDLVAGAANPENQLVGGVPNIDARMWTNSAIVSPIVISAVGNSLVADNTFQPLGTVTITEATGDGVGFAEPAVALPSSLTHLLFFPGLILGGTPTVAVTNNAGQTATITGVDNSAFAYGQSGSMVEMTVNTAAASTANLTAGTFVISGVLARTGTAGPIGTILYDPLTTGPFSFTTLSPPSATRTLGYLAPDDQTQGGSTFDSDVNQPLLVVSFSLAVAVPQRVGGADRYETAAKIASNLSCGDYAVIASGTSDSDALSANYLAGRLARWTGNDVPVLLTGTSVPEFTKTALRNLGVKNVYIVGGTAAVSKAVADEIDALNAFNCGGSIPSSEQTLGVVRIAGATRYETNRAVVGAGSAINTGSMAFDPFLQTKWLQPAKKTAILATGTNFADALAAGPVTYGEGFPLILTDGTATSLTASANAALVENDITQVLVLGGTAAIKPEVAAELTLMGIQVIRIEGSDRYQTATKLADFARLGTPTALQVDGGLGWSYSTVLLASGTTFADALAAGPWGGDRMWPIVLTTQATLAANTQAWLTANRVPLSSVVTLGLGSAVSTAAMNAANLAIV
ncbi:MAG TPA: hypothetical protein DEG43_08680 [Acidimicrobiaceae bacterium]|nr:hypothetical protein [Acidimicrobiaceae bacterium]